MAANPKKRKFRSPYSRATTKCPMCGKLRFLQRADAKAFAKTHELHGLSAYRCGAFWHLGHLPKIIKHGRASRDSITNRQVAS